MTQTKPKTRLRVGLLVDDVAVNKYVKAFALWAKAQDDIDVVCILTRENTGRKTSREKLSLRISAMFYRLIVVFETALIGSNITGRHSVHIDHFTKFDIRQIGIEAISVNTVSRRSAGAYPYTEESIHLIKQCSLDILINCCTGILSNEILTTSKLGVITFFYGDPKMGRCGPHGFWQTYYGWSGSECRIEIVSGKRRERQVLMRGNFSTKLIYLLNQASLYTKTYSHLRRLLKTVVAANAVAPVQTNNLTPASTIEDDSLVSHYGLPKWHESALYIGKVCARLGKRMALDVAKLRGHWGISIISDDWTRAQLTKSSALISPTGRFWADPFLYKYRERSFCFVEEFVYETSRGHIAALELHEGGDIIEHGPVLVENFHLSFPYVFEYQGATFMCPECSASRAIILYRCIELPGRWEVEKILMKDVSAADTMIFQKNGKCWMLTNMDHSGGEDYTAELYLFHAESPFADNWTEHPQSPIKLDCQGGRNGGLIVEENRIFRVGQRQGFGQYGKGICIYEIRTLNENIYEETLVREIHPNFRAGLLGTHHLSSIAGMTAIDHVARRFIR